MDGGGCGWAARGASSWAREEILGLVDQARRSELASVTRWKMEGLGLVVVVEGSSKKRV